MSSTYSVLEAGHSKYTCRVRNFEETLVRKAWKVGHLHVRIREEDLVVGIGLG